MQSIWRAQMASCGTATELDTQTRPVLCEAGLVLISIRVYLSVSVCVFLRRTCRKLLSRNWC